MLFTYAFVGFEVVNALLAAEHYHMTALMLGIAYAVFGIVMAIVQGGFSGLLRKKLGEKRTALFSTGMMVH